MKHYRTCTLCEAMCGVVIETDGPRILSVRGDEDDPFSRGHVCPKAVALKDVHEDPDRLRTPLRREGDRFVPMEWDEAFDLVARELTRIRREHGVRSVATYQGNPSVHNYGSLLFMPLFVRGLGTQSRFSATSVDQLPHMLAALLMFGHQLLLPIPDLDRTNHLLVLGANPAVSNGSLMTAPNVKKRIEGIRARGGRVVVVDPRRTETAQLATEHLFIRPGADAQLLLALVHTLFDEGLVAPGRLAPMLTGSAELTSLTRAFSPERVAEHTGIDALTTRRLAREFARAERAVCYGRVGVSMQEFGGLACWLVNVLNTLTGNLDRVGGAMFTTPAVDVIRPTLPVVGPGHYDRYRTRVRGLPEFGGELPVAALSEEIDTPGEGQIRALVTLAGNPVLSTPNGRRLERALARLDFMVSIDIYMNETSRHAHVILPPTFALEHDHYDLVFHALSVRNTAKYSPALFERAANVRHDWEILNELTWRVAKGKLGRVAARAQSALLGKLGPTGITDVLLRLGRNGDRYVPRAQGLSIAALRRAPHGVDLGPLVAGLLPERLVTKSKQVDLAPAAFVADVQRLERAMLARANGREGARSELVLIGRRQLRSNNSWMHNTERLVKGKASCTLLMHPDDARARDIAHGDTVELRSRVGSVRAPVSITDSVMQGVVSLPHGHGHDRPGMQLRVASQHAGASINDLTDELAVDLLAGTAAFSGCPVEVTLAPKAALADPG